MTGLGTRAVLRRIDAGGLEPVCVVCLLRCKFVARTSPRQVIANVYEGDCWDRTEHFHEGCYILAGAPHGPADSSRLLTRVASR